MPSLFAEGPAAVIFGWPAHVLDTLLARHGAPYLAAMTAGQRAEVEAAHAALHRAGLRHVESATSVDGSAEVPSGSDGASSESPPWVAGLTTGAVAERLGVTSRQVVNLIGGDQLSAIRIGRTWLIDAQSVEDLEIARAS